MQDGQHGTVVGRIEKLVRVPAGGERTGFRFPITHDAGDEQIGVIEGRAEGMGQRVAQFAALVNRAGRLGRDVTRNAAGERELFEETPHPLFVLRDVRINLAIRLLQICVGHQPGAAMAGTGDVDDVQVVLLDHAIQVHVHEVQARRRAPMTEQTRLDVGARERLLQQRVVIEVDLSDRQIVCGAPVGVDSADELGTEW